MSSTAFLWMRKSFSILLFFIAINSIIAHKALANMENIKQSCFLSVSPASSSPDKILLNFSFKNPHTKKMRLLMWNTPFEGFFSDLFLITNIDTQEQLIYHGPMIKRLHPQPDDYLLISPSDVSTTTLNLSLAYHFTPGNYQIKLKVNTLHYKDENLSLFPVVCETSSIEFVIK
jgi:hypothetical protein